MYRRRCAYYFLNYLALLTPRRQRINILNIPIALPPLRPSFHTCCAIDKGDGNRDSGGVWEELARARRLAFRGALVTNLSACRTHEHRDGK